LEQEVDEKLETNVGKSDANDLKIVDVEPRNEIVPKE
jgi:hypothetical protein